MRTYAAPWSISLIVISAIVSLICAAVTVTLIWHGRFLLVIFPVVGPVLALLFLIRGYTVTPDSILIHRLLWTTRVPLSGLESAKYQPDAMSWSLRTFGNGGFFSITGWYRNSALGAYRAYVTDPRRTVILHFPARIIVVSPDKPEEFARDLTFKLRAA